MKDFVLVAIGLVCLGLLVACPVINTPVPVTGISLDQTTASVAAHASTTLTATVNPPNAADTVVVWTTSDSTIATVANGVVTGVATGSATITGTTHDGNKTATSAITVTASAPTPADLVGTWTTVYTMFNSTYVNYQLQFSADGTFSESYNDFAATTYTGTKGSFVCGTDYLRLTITQTRTSGTPFTDGTTGWATASPAIILTMPCILYNGKVYSQYINKAIGQTNGIIGSWSFENTKDLGSLGSGGNWLKSVYTFTESTLTQYMFTTTSTTYPTSPSTTNTFACTDNGNGTVNIGSPPGSNLPFVISGPWLILSGAATASYTACAWVKQ